VNPQQPSSTNYVLFTILRVSCPDELVLVGKFGRRELNSLFRISHHCSLESEVPK
jgi:hypothetical protein